jgi:hypothetical protein
MLHKHPPITKEKMNWISPKNSICQKLRDIYHASQDEDVRMDCRVAMSMAKAMNRKLEQYQKGWDKDYWDENPKFKPLMERARKGEVEVRVVE